jgi:hypothetical protein
MKAAILNILKDQPRGGLDRESLRVKAIDALEGDANSTEINKLFASSLATLQKKEQINVDDEMIRLPGQEVASDEEKHNKKEKKEKKDKKESKHDNKKRKRYLLTHLLTHLFTHLLTHLLTYLLTHLLTYLLTHSPTSPYVGELEVEADFSECDSGEAVAARAAQRVRGRFRDFHPRGAQRQVAGAVDRRLTSRLLFRDLHLAGAHPLGPRCSQGCGSRDSFNNCRGNP